MRIGGTITRFFQRVSGNIQKLLSLSLDWQVVTEDIGWAFEDIADILGMVLSPFLEWIASWLEVIADFLERNPAAAYAVGFALLAALIGPTMNATFSPK